MSSGPHLLTLLLFTALTACKGEDKDTAPAGDDTDSGQTDSPTVTLTAPADGAEVTAPVTISYTVSGLTLDPDNLGGSNVDGQGHVHIYVDGTYTDATGESSYSLTTLAAGSHTLEVRLANNDHSELDGAVDSVTVTATEAAKPLVAITSPAYGDTIDASSAWVEFTIQNFALSDNIGGTAASGEGHYHLYLDGAYVDYGSDPDGAWITRLTPGTTHILGVELVNNDHSSLSPKVQDAVEITVPSDAYYVELDKPHAGDVLDSSSWEVAVSVDNFELSPEHFGSTTKVPGEGHYHVYVDDVYQTASADDSTWLYQQTTGDHIVMAVLAENDHTELSSVDYVRVSSPEDRPYIKVASPADGEILGSDFNVSIDYDNFTLSTAAGGANVEDQGHWHLYVDGVYWGYSTTRSFTVEDMSNGVHELTAELTENDHNALDPRVIDVITVNVE